MDSEKQPNTASENDPSNPERNRPLREPPSIYVASLADYNNGRLYGTWIDATQDPDEIRAEIATMLRRSPQLQREGETFGDWAIHDFDGFSVAPLGELEDLEHVVEIARGIENHGDVFAVWARVSEHDNDREGRLTERFADAYLGHYDSATDYGEQLWSDMGWQEKLEAALPAEVLAVVNVNADVLVRDLVMGGDLDIVDDPNGGVWVFLGNV